MSVKVNLYSEKKGEINSFLYDFYNTNIDLNNIFTWEKDYLNPIEIADIIGTYIDNSEKYEIKMWIHLDKNAYININNSNGNYIIQYLFERFPY